MSVSDTADSANQNDADEKPKLTLDVKVEETGSCGRHVTVTVSKEDVARYFDEAFSELVPNANVPGFRSGRAPRKLVESRFKNEINDQVKGSLLMDSMTQVTAESDFAAISEPDFDFGAIELEPGDALTFEFDIEVRPEFSMPNWKGLKLERLAKEFDRKDVDAHLQRILGDSADIVPHDGKAEANEYVMVQMTFSRDGKTISECTEQVRITPRLSFPDAIIDGFDKLMVGAEKGDKKETTLRIGHDVANEELRGEEVTVAIEVLDVMKIVLPELDDAMMSELGDFDSEGDLRDAVQADLERRLEFQRRKGIREQITAKLTASADWDLPQDLLRRQSHRELERAILELRAAGFGEEEILAHENELRQNSMDATRTALKEHFILERIAEEETIEEGPEDYELEIASLAAQSRESVRKVRARIEKQGLMDALRNQIIERKVIEKITEAAEFTDVPYVLELDQVFAIDHSVSGAKDSAIPVAKHGGDAEHLKLPTDRT